MEILVLTPTPTWPPDLGGRKAIVSLHKELKKHGRLHFVLYGAEGEWRDGFDEAALNKMRGQWDSFHLIAPTRPVHEFAKGEDHEPDEWWDDAIGAYLRWRFERSQFDAFVVHYTWLSKALTFAPSSTRKILYTSDQFSGRRALFETRGFPREYFHLSKEGEAAALARADTVVAIKEQEEAFFRTICRKNIITIPHYERPIIGAMRERTKSGVLRIGMLGGNNTINRENLREFMATAEPIFSRSMAPIEIVVAGGLCDALADFSSPFVRVMGPVDDVVDFYRQVDAVIVPMMWSTGMKIKFGEALAAFKPVLSTAHAAEGYATPDPAMCCADFEELAKACVRVSFDSVAFLNLKAAGHAAALQMKTRFELGVHALVDDIKRWSPGVAILASGYIGGTGSSEFLRLFDILRYTRSLAKTDIVLTPDTEISRTAERKLAAVASVVRMNAALDDLKRYSVVVMTSTLREPVDALKAHQGDIIVLGAQSHEVDGLQPLVSFGSAPHGSGGARHYRAPYFVCDAGHVVERWRQEASHPQAIAILHDRRTLRLADRLAEIARSLAPRLLVEFHDAEAYPSALACDRWSRTVAAGVKPQVVLDVAAADFDQVRELFMRAAVPVISYRPERRLRPRATAPQQTRLVAGSMAELLKALHDAVMGAPSFAPLKARAKQRADCMFRNDAGWTLYWHSLASILEARRWGIPTPSSA